MFTDRTSLSLITVALCHCIVIFLEVPSTFSNTNVY